MGEQRIDDPVTLYEKTGFLGGLDFAGIIFGSIAAGFVGNRAGRFINQPERMEQFSRELSHLNLPGLIETISTAPQTPEAVLAAAVSAIGAATAAAIILGLVRAWQLDRL